MRSSKDDKPGSAEIGPAEIQRVPLDHVIFYAGFDLPDAASLLARFGFTLTPKGRHTIGSVNQLAILDDVYIELIGFEPGTPPNVRPDLQRQTPGLNGVALRENFVAEDGRVQNTHWNAPMILDRLIDLGEEKNVVSFRITTLSRKASDFRIFLCHHFTPQFVWRPEWKVHANCVVGVESICLKSDETLLVRDMLAIANHAVSSGQEKLVEIHIEETKAKDASRQQVGDRSSVKFLTRDLARVIDVLQHNGVSYRALGADEIVASLPEPLNVDFEFFQQAE
jgi:hypothetical protein